MFKNLIHDTALSVQAKTGLSAGLFVWVAIIAFAALMACVFLCVAGYEWLSLLIGPVFAGLVAAAVFIVIALIGLLVCGMIRRRTRERAILERAARARAPSWLVPSWLLDPKILGTAVQVGRAVGWQRIIPVALLGFMAAQWAREYRDHGQDDAS
jgi:uncharacterized membrane protein